MKTEMIPEAETNHGSLLIAAYKLTGDKKYLEPVPASYFIKREFNKEKIADRLQE